MTGSTHVCEHALPSVRLLQQAGTVVMRKMLAARLALLIELACSGLPHRPPLLPSHHMHQPLITLHSRCQTP